MKYINISEETYNEVFNIWKLQGLFSQFILGWFNNLGYTKTHVSPIWEFE